MKNKLIGILSAALSLSSLLVLASCGSQPSSVVSVNQVLAIQGEESAVEVGKTITLGVNSGTPSDFLWTSSDESILTVSEGGEVTGIAPGKATVTAYSKDDYSKKATVDISVYSAGDDGKETHALAIDASKALVSFGRGDSFSVEGLVVTLDGKAVTDFTTNPAVGTPLNTLGEKTVVVSYPGAVSQTYKITVTEAKEDLSLQEAVKKLASAKSYTYQVQIDGKVQIDTDGTLANKVVYTFQYGEKAFYLKSTADDQVIADYNYGFVDTSKGVLRYKVEDELVTPLYYASHQYTDYTKASTYSFGLDKDLNPDLVGTRQSNGSFLITNHDFINDLVSNSYVITSNVSNNLKSVKGYVDEDGFHFVLDCGPLGFVTETYSQLNSTTPSYINDYLKNEGEDIPVIDGIKEIQTYVKKNNYTRDLGSASIKDESGNSTSYDIGKRYYTPNYEVTKYNDDYLTAYNKANPDNQIKSNGFFIKDGTISSFDLEVVDGKESVTNVTEVATGQTDLPSYDDAEYPSRYGALQDDNLDTFEYKYVESYQGNLYLSYADSFPREISEDLGISYSSTGLTPMAFGANYAKSAVDDSKTEVQIVAYVFDLSGTYYVLGYSLTDFGTTSYATLDEYLK